MNHFEEIRNHIRRRTWLAFLRVLATYAACGALLAALAWAVWRAAHR